MFKNRIFSQHFISEISTSLNKKKPKLQFLTFWNESIIEKKIVRLPGKKVTFLNFNLNFIISNIF